jgi:NAD(P)-dependent dehydrogenase (short-subunit alcohol dehydrogenase family)
MNGCQQAARAMAGRPGAIYNLYGAGSDGRPVPGMIGYATTKRAVQFYTQALAAELEGSPLIVGGLSPGLVLTEGFFREHAKVPASARPAREAVVNILGDEVATLARWVVRIVLSNRDTGREFTWLTARKLRMRRSAIPPRDVLAPYRDERGELHPGKGVHP